MPISKFRLIALVTLILTLLAGCKDNKRVCCDPPPPPLGLPFPDSPAKLMANFQTIYEIMDYAGCQDLLAPDYQMILRSSTTVDFPELGATLDYTEEMGIADHMFSGADGHDAEGYLMDPISTTIMQDPEQLTGWDVSPSDDPIPDTDSALFNVDMDFFRAGDHSLNVFGQLKVYISARDSLYQGEVRPYYQIAGIWDLTDDGGKGTESTCFGYVKALFR